MSSIVRALLPLCAVALVTSAAAAQSKPKSNKGDVEFLKTIPAELIYSLKLMSMTEVGARFGPSSGPGIVVTLKH
jgi:hypothetical protein